MALVTELFRQRFVVLGALGVLAATGMIYGLFTHAVPVGAFFLTASSLAAGFGVAFVHLRHVALAAVAVAAPLPGMIWAWPFAATHGVGMLPLVAAYGFATLAGAAWCSEMLRGIADGRDRTAAILVRPAPMVRPVAVAVLVAGVVLLGWFFRIDALRAAGIAVEMFAGVLSALLFVTFGALALPFSETAVTDINRARERRAVRLRFLAHLIEPRWGLSLAGVEMVLAVLGYFALDALQAKGAMTAHYGYWSAAALVVFAATFGVGRDWRDALAGLVALAVETLLGLWLWAIAVGQLTTLALVVVVMTDAVSLMPILVLVGKARSYRMDGDAPDIARLKAMEDGAVPAVYGCACAGAAIMPWVVLHGSMVTLAMLFALAAIESTIGAPAIATALETMVRRRYSVEKLYGRG
ncbi:MAG: hypothetical protein ISS15_13395 [Alphaproteobacteria bacterium]|nr:hypothetical protein [Alphaproteobacteria bacterium]MBL7098648.1 hypothetical protein [Alphaproteobacteria bacterium]